MNTKKIKEGSLHTTSSQQGERREGSEGYVNNGSIVRGGSLASTLRRKGGGGRPPMIPSKRTDAISRGSPRNPGTRKEKKRKGRPKGKGIRKAELTDKLSSILLIQRGRQIPLYTGKKPRKHMSEEEKKKKEGGEPGVCIQEGKETSTSTKTRETWMV